MIGTIVKKLFGSRNDRELARIRLTVEKINALEAGIAALDDAALQGKTAEFRQRLANGEALDALLPEAFAVCREAGKRTLNMRHFDAQLIGGIVLHEGKIAEMKTGEGKTLVATLPIYLNALTGKGAHLITVNDYLARRDAEWMGKIYRFLGMSVGVIQHGLSDAQRQESYGSDVTYGTNNEFGFDYLRDNMKFDLASCVQRELNFALVDEVDSILIDEARTPLIISGPAEESTDKYETVDRIMPQLLKKEVFYTLDEKARTVALNEEGVTKAEELLGVGNLYDPRNVEILHHVNQAMKAHVLFKLDVDYVVKDGQVLIVDEFTGRLMPGRRFSDGLHQALEAKERVKIENENQTLATITFQNFFRLYNKLAGMTGTADTEASEFNDIYKLEVIIVPTHRPMVRLDHADLIYRTAEEKYEAIIDEIVATNKKGQPSLVGTISIEKSETLSTLLKRKGVKHNVLNAKQHEREAEIVAQAGRKGAVTIATNMAGRGTDIILGGNAEMLMKSEELAPEDEGYEERMAELKTQCETERGEVLTAGGLKIIGTERHESRRIDNQLRGRSGRQGDPGASRFYLSLEDDLMRIFGSERLSTIMEKLGMERGEPIEHGMVTKALENAQKRVEGHNYDIRKHLLEYDDVMNKQREVIYSQRRMILEGADLKATLLDMADETAQEFIAETMDEKAHPEEWDLEGLKARFTTHFGLRVEQDGDKNLLIGASHKLDYKTMLPEEVLDAAEKELEALYEEKERAIGAARYRDFQQYVMLNVVDNQWKEHLLIMDHLKEGISFRGYAQKNPLNEYKREGHGLFEEMIARFRQEVTAALFKVEVEERAAEAPLQRKTPTRTVEHRGDVTMAEEPHTVKRDHDKVGRNDPCPCGSGKKYKKCHGK
ncbi:MAG: preprotein translocase subunit SecA [Nitrospinae bacterium]|nr:preprotein translocase subunit SecA [Nitrospinota bacterium]